MNNKTVAKEFFDSPANEKEHADSERAALLNDEMQKQSQYFSLRAQFLAAILQGHTYEPHEAFLIADACARRDFMTRCEEARDMMKAMGETMRMPKLYEIFYAQSPKKGDPVFVKAETA